MFSSGWCLLDKNARDWRCSSRVEGRDSRVERTQGRSNTRVVYSRGRQADEIGLKSTLRWRERNAGERRERMS